MTDLLYLHDHYLKEFDAKIDEFPSDDTVVLNRTAIYPRGGGQPSDHATLTTGSGRKLEVIDSFKDNDKAICRLSSALNENERSELMGSGVHGAIDWDLRYKHMRHHTALHILSGVVYLKFNSRITGGQIYPDRARLDFTLSDLSKARLDTITSEANKIVREDKQVRAFWLSAEEALKQPELYRLSADLLPKWLDKLRIVEIVGFDAQLDGGTHVARTGEIGEIKISKTENKGKDNKRIEIVLA
jgi:misacylated tRNA(Ala) deacylase